MNDLGTQFVDSGELAVQNNINYLYWIIFALFLLVVIFIVRYFFKYFSVRDKSGNNVIFLVKLPKEKPKDKDKDFNIQQLREEIAQGETIFSSIGGMRAQRGLRAWFFGRTDNFSFEIVAHKSKISFFVSAPVEKALYLEQQIHAYYPEASVEAVEDYNAFSSQGTVMAGYFKAKRSFIFPFLDYTDMEYDPMNSIINVMSKLESDESIAVQYVVRSAKKIWHAKLKGQF